MQSYKLCLIGNSDAGKTSIINSYLGLPIDTEVTVIANFKALPVTFIKNNIEHRVKFQVVDTAGQERYCHVIPNVLFRNADAGLVVFDLSDPYSLLGLDKRIEQFRMYSKPDSVLFLIGNKRDIALESKTRTEMQHESIMQLMNEHQMSFYFKTSALTGAGIQDMFQTTAQLLDTLLPVQEFNVVAQQEINSAVSLREHTQQAFRGVYQFCKF